MEMAARADRTEKMRADLLAAKEAAKGKAKKGAVKSKAEPPAPAPAPALVKADPKVAGIEKKLAAARKKLEAARAGGAPTRNIEDRIYELEDDLRLGNQSA